MSYDFMHDLIRILKQKKEDISAAKEKDDFEKGCELAYYDSLDIIRTQLIAFGYDPQDFGLSDIKLE